MKYCFTDEQVGQFLGIISVGIIAYYLMPSASLLKVMKVLAGIYLPGIVVQWRKR